MWLMIFITVLASTGSNVGKALQKQATSTLPKMTWERRILYQYARNRKWVTGVASDLGGGLLMAVALSNAPVSVVQPVSSVGLVVLAIFSHFYLKEYLAPYQWCSALFCLIGTIGLGSSESDAEGEQSGKPNNVPIASTIMTLIFFLAALGLFSLWRQKALRTVKGKGSSIVQNQGLVYGLEAGGYFGLSAASCRTGFLLSNVSILWIPAGLGASGFLSSVGFVTQTQGLKDGSTVMVCTFANVSAMVTGVLVGLIALGESFPNSPSLRAMKLISWFFLALGVATSTPGASAKFRALDKIVSFLPRRLRVHFRKLEKETPSLPVQNPELDNKI